MQKNIRISPSILASDFSRLGEEVKDISRMGADFIHLDIMDGCFVPNLSFGADIVKAVRPHSHLPFDVHLMIDSPERYIQSYVDAGADIITVHPEATFHIHSTLQKIRETGTKVGIALNPGTSIQVLDGIADLIDLILIMTVNPGFGGQSFLNSQLRKISDVRLKIDELKQPIDLSVDGGINRETAKLAIEAGANVLVAGTAIFRANGRPYSETIDKLRNPYS
ncbi:MAG: ribulose-phosphate 3-epimerase [Rhodospirillaceae bacterium]|nr:ribulose-phosphate 3-epimerase [Rhodospirillaceae bacterium]|tara:strand:+ start:386 stop:1054 length:669 start_codon:yes stop_codon:yes gene_type:complete